MYLHSLLIRILLIVFAISVCIQYGCVLSSRIKINCGDVLEELNAMKENTIIDYGDYDIQHPNVYCPGDYIRYIFAVPKHNMVGTNELDNAIKLLEFKENGKISEKYVKKDFMDMVTGPFSFRFLPVWSDNEIAYSQSKGFLLINLQTRKVEMHTICPGMYGCDIEKVAVLNAEDRTFVFETLYSNSDRDGNVWNDKVLKVIRFQGETFSIISEKGAGKKTFAYTEPWFVYQKRIFIYNDSETRLEAFNENLQPERHPIVEAFNQNKSIFRRMQEFVVHPSLPFALIIERGKRPPSDKVDKALAIQGDAGVKAIDSIYKDVHRLTLYLFRWTHPDPDKRLVPLLSAAGSLWGNYNPENNYSDFTFSPDGKWVVFRDKSFNYKNPVFVAVPIDENNPLYLGKPVKLGNASREDAIGPTGTAWTTNPTAFVMCDRAVLYRWNLDAYDSCRKVKVPPNTPDPFVKEEEY